MHINASYDKCKKDVSNLLNTSNAQMIAEVTCGMMWISSVLPYILFRNLLHATLDHLDYIKHNFMDFI